MGFFRFRRSVKIFPGVRWNFGKNSTSLSIGGRGAHYTFGTSGSRTTVGIPGTGLSYTDIHSSHRRVAQRHAGIPTPSESWVRSNQVDRTLHIPDRRPDEAPIRPDQIAQFNNLEHVNFKGYDFSTLGSDQADALLIQVKEQQREVSKSLLKKFYADHGHAIPDDFIDHCYDHPDQAWTERRTHGCLLLIGFLLLMGLIGSFFKKPDAVTSSAPATPPDLLSPSSKTPMSPSFPDPKFWPKQIRLAKEVQLSGIVDGGLIHMTAKPGEVLDATLSDDHKMVTVRRLDITGTLPIEETDFVERARKASTGQ
jgi:hypothetical protein